MDPRAQHAAPFRSHIVMTEPVTLSAAQIAAVGAIYPRNFRPVQPRNRRTLGRN